MQLSGVYGHANAIAIIFNNTQQLRIVEEIPLAKLWEHGAAERVHFAHVNSSSEQE